MKSNITAKKMVRHEKLKRKQRPAPQCQFRVPKCRQSLIFETNILLRYHVIPGNLMCMFHLLVPPGSNAVAYESTNWLLASKRSVAENVHIYAGLDRRCIGNHVQVVLNVACVTNYLGAEQPTWDYLCFVNSNSVNPYARWKRIRYDTPEESGIPMISLKWYKNVFLVHQKCLAREPLNIRDSFELLR